MYSFSFYLNFYLYLFLSPSLTISVHSYTCIRISNFISGPVSSSLLRFVYLQLYFSSCPFVFIFISTFLFLYLHLYFYISMSNYIASSLFLDLHLYFHLAMSISISPFLFLHLHLHSYFYNLHCHHFHFNLYTSIPISVCPSTQTLSLPSLFPAKYLWTDTVVTGQPMLASRPMFPQEIIYSLRLFFP